MNGHTTKLKRDSVLQVLSAWTGIPLRNLVARDDLAAALANLEIELGAHLLGQQAAATAIARTLRSRLLLGVPPERHRPLAVLLLHGPSGVGKTESARILARTLYGNDACLTRIDLSEFNAEHTSARLVGAPPGYVGYDRGGELTNALRARRYGVLLLDEADKCHHTILARHLLPLVGEGVVHDMSTGELVDAREYLVLLTANSGANAERPELALPPEFRGRLDAVITFAPLDSDALGGVLARELDQLAGSLSARFCPVRIRLAAGTADQFLCRLAEVTASEGARAVQRVVAQLLAPRCMELLAEAASVLGPAEAPVMITCSMDAAGDLMLRLEPEAHTKSLAGDDCL